MGSRLRKRMKSVSHQEEIVSFSDDDESDAFITGKAPDEEPSNAEDNPSEEFGDDHSVDGESGGIDQDDKAPPESDDEETSIADQGGVDNKSKTNTALNSAKGKIKTAPTSFKSYTSMKFVDGTASHLPPMNSQADFMAEFLEKLLSSNFSGFLKRLDGRPLRIATACSGTEAPLLFLNLLSQGTFSKNKSLTCHTLTC